MKKLIALLLAVSVLFSLALTGCKSETPDDIGDNETAASGNRPDRIRATPGLVQCSLSFPDTKVGSAEIPSLVLSACEISTPR